MRQSRYTPYALLAMLAAGGALLPLVTGCSMQDFGSMGDVSEIVTDTNLKDSAQSEARADQLARMLVTWNQQPQDAKDEEYPIGPEDVLLVSVFALERPGQPSELTRRVNVNGMVNLPFVGDLKVAGLTAREAIKAVTAAYEGTYLRNPQVDVNVTEFRSAPVVVTGAVKQPGVYFLRRRSSTILEMLSLANGLAVDAGNELLIVRAEPEPATTNAIPDTPATDTPSTEPSADAPPDSDADETGTPAIAEDPQAAGAADQMVSIDLRRLLESGDIRLNVPVHGGDVITIPPRQTQYVYVLGYVQRPGAVEVRTDDKLQALQAVAMAGGLSGSARAQNSTLITEKDGLRQTLTVDLTSMKRGKAPPAYMKPGDILIVGSSSLAKFAEFIKLSAGASYSPTP